MNTSQNISARLTTISNSLPIHSPLRKVCLEAAERIECLYNALDDLTYDSQHADHNCGDRDYCPVMKARIALCLGRKTN